MKFLLLVLVLCLVTPEVHGLGTVVDPGFL
jgi:hypothetical protein